MANPPCGRAAEIDFDFRADALIRARHLSWGRCAMNMLPDVKSLEPIGDDTEGGFHPLFADVPSSVEFNKLRKRLLRLTRQAIEDFAMVKPGERWLVALSGGKDSYGLLALLLDLKWRGLLPVELLACNLDQGQPNFPKHILPCLLYTSPSPRDRTRSRMPSSA